MSVIGAASWLDGLADALRSRGVAARVAVRHGVVQAQVVELAKETDATFVVLLTHSRGGRRWLFSRDDGGEHADLMDHTSPPVLTLQKGAPARDRTANTPGRPGRLPERRHDLPDVSKLAVASGARAALMHVLSTAANDSTHAMRAHLYVEPVSCAARAAWRQPLPSSATRMSARPSSSSRRRFQQTLSLWQHSPAESLAGWARRRSWSPFCRTRPRPPPLKNPGA